MKSKKSKIITLSILLIAIVCSVIFAVGASNDASTPYYKVVYMDIDDYRKDLNNLVAPEYPDSDEYIFAGWFTDDECTTALGKTIQTGAAYAKFVPKTLLGIKAQVNYDLYDSDTTNDDTKTYKVTDEETGETTEVEKGAGAIRFVTSVDSLNYAEIGFVFDRGKGEEIKSSTSVYKTLYATVGETDVNGQKTEEFVPSELFDESSVYFKTWTYSKVPSSAYNTEIKVTPFWITLDGTTVKAEQGIKTVNQGRSWEYVYVDSQTGSDNTGVGTKGNPYATLNKALSEMKANYEEPYVVSYSLNTTNDTEGADGIVCIKDSLKADETFTWEDHDMDVIITSDIKDISDLSTVVDTSTVDFSALSALNMGDGASFENVTIKMPTAVYACGNRLKISDTSMVDSSAEIYGGGYETAVDSTNITLLTGTYACIYGGSRTAAVNGNTYVYVGGDVNSTINVKDHDGTNSVWAGCRGGKVYGNTELVVAGEAKFHYIRGGGAGSSTAVNGTAYVTIIENAQAIGVNGGGSNSGSVNNTYVVMKGGTVEQIFGGAPKNGGTVANSNVIIEDGSVTRRIYGGSYNEWLLGWQDNIHVDGYSSVTLGQDIALNFEDDDDNSLAAVSRHNTNLGTEIGVMIVNPGVSAELGFHMSISGAPLYTHFLVNVVEDGASGTVTSESGVLRITPDNASNYATVKDSDGNLLFYCQGEGTYHLPELSETISSPEELTVSFDTTAPSYTEDIVAEVSYGDGNVGYYTSLETALSSVSTPQVAENQVATVTVYSESVSVASTIEITDGDNVVIQNKAGQNLTFTRDENLTDTSMFNVAFGSSLSFKCNNGTVTVDGAKVAGISMVDNAGTFVLEEGATLQNGTTAVPGDDVTNKNVKTYHGGALYNTGVAYIHGTVQNNSAYYGGAIYIASDGIVELETNNSATISGNIAGYRGGAIFINRGTLNASGYVFTDNNSSNYGGAIYINAYMSGSDQIKAQANLYNCTFGGTDAGNSATAGGAILVAGSLVADKCTFESNKTTSASGGAIEVYEENVNFDADITVTNSTFTNNTAKGYSGAIDINGGGNGVDGTDNIKISNCNFKGNSSEDGGTIAVRKFGTQIDISDLTFEGDASGNVDVIYILQPSDAIAYESVAISGVISKAEIYIAKQPASGVADETKAPIVINGHLSSESDITVTPAYTYVEEIKLVAKSDDTVSDKTFKNAIKVLDLAQVAGNYWFVDSTGCLSQVSATINGTEGSYADALAAIEGTTSGAVTIEFLRDIEIADTITIPAGADVTITNATGKDVTITRTCTTALFSVVSGSTLTIGSEDTANKLVVDGGYVADTENPLEAQSLVSNAGNFVLAANATIQNAVTDGTNSYLGGALNNAANAQATINGTICGCSAYNGGAIYNDTKGEVIITASARFADNIANGGNGGAIRNRGSLTITGASFSGNKGVGTTYGNGGAIYNTGTLISQDAAYEENTARSGGAVYNESSSGTLSITGGNFTKNSAAITSGSGGTGGAVYVKAKSGRISFVNVEFTKNSSNTNQSAAIDAQATITLTGCNIHDNVASENSSNAIYDVRIGSATLNVEDDTKIDAVYYQPDETGMVAIGETFTGDIILVPNDYTVGTQLVTFAEGITDTTSVVSKLVVGKAISGQVYQADAYYIDTEGLLQEYEGVAKVGNVSYDTLAEAIESVDTEEETTICLLSNAEFNGTIAIGGESTNRNITIINSNGENIAITRTEASSMISVADGSSLTIAGNEKGSLTLDGNKELATPHLIKNEGTFIMEKGVTILNAITARTKNDEAYNGGALFNTGSATLKGIFKGCYGYNGGAVFNDKNAEMQVIGATFTNNISKGNGGAIRNQGALTVEKSNFDTNISEDYNGGAIYTDTADFEVTNTTFSNNTAFKSGGAIYATGPNCTIINCDFSSNTATSGTGGAVRATNSLTITGGTYTDNKAATGGAAVEVAGTGIISGVEMYDNSLTTTSGSTFYGGGAIYVTSGKKLTLSDSNIYNNTSNHETVPSCDISNNGTLTLTGIKADDENEATTEQCLVYQSNTLYYVGEDGEMLNEK